MANHVHDDEPTAEVTTSPLLVRRFTAKLEPVAELLFHYDLRRIGAHVVVGQERATTIGRNTVFGGVGPDNPVGDPCVSRTQLTVRWSMRHLSFSVEPSPTSRLRVRATSPTGTPQRLDAVPPGSLLAVGDRMLLHLTCRHAPGDDLGLVGTSEAMWRLRRDIEAAACLALPVLVTGETGTGKELVARALHDQSPRAGGPYRAVNCGALAAELIESELFGFLRGAFTGADRDQRGLFRAADGGTLFLDEVGELASATQVKLLRVLETGTVRPVGASSEVPISVRVVAATHRDLAERVRSGVFREDLYYRLRAPTIQVPALRERREDVPRLFAHFLAEHLQAIPALGRLFCVPQQYRPPVPLGFFVDLMRRRWPGNVREVRKYAAAVAVANAREGPFATPEWDDGAPEPSAESVLPPPRHRRTGRPTEPALSAVLAAHDYVQSRAAKALGISRNTLEEWMCHHGIRRPSDLEPTAIDAALEAHGQDVEAAARALRVSRRGLKLRLKELGR